MELTGLKHRLYKPICHNNQIELAEGTSLGELDWFYSNVDYGRYECLFEGTEVQYYSHYGRGYYADPFVAPATGELRIKLPSIGLSIGKTYSSIYRPGYHGIQRELSVPFTTSENTEVSINVEQGELIYIVAKNASALSGTVVYTYCDPYFEIDEPIGFDNISTKIKRNDFHGMSASYSEDTLGFTKEAAYVLEDDHNNDIDTLRKYEVVDMYDNVIFSAYIDYTTYTKKYSDSHIVECKVAEIGAKTIFNNRIETNIDLNTDKTIDGAALSHVADWKNIPIPLKHLAYTNFAKQQRTATSNKINLGYNSYSGNLPYLVLNFDTVKNEFGSFSVGQTNSYSSVESVPNFYTPGSDFVTKYGNVNSIDIEVSIKLGVVRFPIAANDENLYLKLIITDGENSCSTGWYNFHWGNGVTREVDNIIKLKLDATSINPSRNIKIYFESTNLNKEEYTFTVYRDSYIKFSIFDNISDDNVSADMILVHDALNVITEAVSENAINVKSDFYAHKTSLVNPSADAPGYGALKAITNGYKIRGLFTDGTEKRNMPLSFKNAIKSLNALDCIGWGFSTEGGTLYVRIEPWNWFYKNTVLLTITYANSVTVSSDPGSVITELNIGYKKYNTSEEYNSIDSIHSERSFTSKIKAISNDKEHLCEFIADNYAIEETRRAKTQVDSSEEFKYDENIFVFELQDSRIDGATTESLSVATSATNIEGLARPGEFINAKLSPRWCAERWKSYLFRAFSDSPMNFSTGTVNYKAKFGLLSYSRSIGDTSMAYQLRPSEAYNDGQSVPKTAENADIANTHCILDAEIIEFEYPISLAQYQAIKANPYGMISVNGRSGWIKEFTYKLATGIATFKLIAAHTFQSNS